VLITGAAGCGGSSSSSSAPNPNAAESSPPGDIPDNQAFVTYTPPQGGYTVKVPEGWSRRAVGGAVTFTDKLNSIRMEDAAPAGAVSAASARKAELPKLAQSVKGFAGAKVSTVDRTSGKAVRITYLADSPKDPVTGSTHTNAVERYLFPHQGRVAILTLSGPKGADNVDPWRLVTDSLRWSR
jgi:hypothetical protein